MSCNYADGLSPYDNKGVLGIPENFDEEEQVNEKCAQLAKWIESSKHVVIHTGAGISTSAGIPDFRGPKGVWTLERKGEKPLINISFDDAAPTKTHMALKALIEKGYVHYVISQNIDGLHLKSGLCRKYLAELHGNMFVEQCNKCRKQYIRKTATPTVGQKLTGEICKGGKVSRPCRGGYLIDNVLDWEHDLPEKDLDLAFVHSTLADLNITLGTTLQIIPSGTLPLKNKRYGGKLVICNLQATKYDKKADLRISTYVDNILIKICKRLGVEIPEYDRSLDPTKQEIDDINIMEWTIKPQQIKELEKIYNLKIKEHSKKRKSSTTELENNDNDNDEKKLFKHEFKVLKKDVKQEENEVKEKEEN